MSNRRERRARKLEQRTTGVGFQHPVKVGTPFLERAFATAHVTKPDGKVGPRGKRLTRWLADRGIIRE
jgi:hypothetical protein